MDDKPCKNCGSYGGNVGCDVCGPPIRQRDAQERLARTACSALPDAAGFYWWRETEQRPWRMVQILNFAADSDIPYLCAYDVEYRNFVGRTLIQWARHEPIGQWIPIHKPNENCPSVGATEKPMP